MVRYTNANVNSVHRLPHFRERTEPIKYIIIHCSRSNAEKQIETLDKLKLSVHYIIGLDGHITEVVPTDKVAYHAGLSKWFDDEGPSLNSSSIGIELECPDMGQTETSFTKYQTTRLCWLLDRLVCVYHIRRENILAHSDIAPTRKPDPGAGFPWKKLYRAGLIFWYHEAMPDKSTDDERTLLKNIGYDTENIYAARYAFCRRWLPEEVRYEEDIQHLLDNPFPKDFVPQNQQSYIKRLKVVSAAIKRERIRRYWFPKNIK